MSSFDWSMCSRRCFVFNEEVSLRAASAACHHATGWCDRGVASSDLALM